MKPPYEITPTILSILADVMHQLGRLEGMTLSVKTSPQLRRQNRIKTIYSTLAIEGNTLSLDQVTALIDDKLILGPQKDILEVSNAIKLYEQLNTFNCTEVEDFLKAHEILMSKLIHDAGKFRRGGVGIQKGNDIVHIAPPAENVPGLLNDLFAYIRSDLDHKLIQSCVLHYELEFIHPFSDGNGRMGRLWQTLKLMELSPLFEYLPVESLIKSNQPQYYHVLKLCDQAGESTFFIEFMLTQILDSLNQYEEKSELKPHDYTSRIKLAKDNFHHRNFVRADYLKLFPSLSTASASRDLKKALLEKILIKHGTGRMSSYEFNESPS
ncbi:Fic family protein [Lentisphaera marina]|uniref:Fic family protein n=1 Tax=Lentisphaera marina TaxID=1111041 RepID=UPI0023667DDD|nr:Fic family protein [Lentisphaera marina]MDD7986308.1 Fic family protein [Lentisphaera marina]